MGFVGIFGVFGEFEGIWDLRVLGRLLSAGDSEKLLPNGSYVAGAENSRNREPLDSSNIPH